MSLENKFKLFIISSAVLISLLLGLFFIPKLFPDYPLYMTDVPMDNKLVGSPGMYQEKHDDVKYVVHFPETNINIIDEFTEEVEAKYNPKDSTDDVEVLIDYESYKINDRFISVLYTINHNKVPVAYEGRVLDTETNTLLKVNEVLNLRGSRKLTHKIRNQIDYQNKDLAFLQNTDLKLISNWAISHDTLIIIVNNKRFDFSRNDIENYFINQDPIDIPSVYLDSGSNKDDKLLALTFDDGPHGTITPQVLNKLNKFNAKATFFMLGSRIPGNEELLKDSLDHGHQLANHSYSHINFNTHSKDDITKEIQLTNKAIKEATGLESKIMVRPPYGSADEAVLKGQDHIFINWTVDSNDWQDKDPKKACSAVVDDVFDGSIILMHDIYKSSADSLDCILQKLSKEGYKFVTVEELLKTRLDEIKPHKIYYRAKPSDH